MPGRGGGGRGGGHRGGPGGGGFVHHRIGGGPGLGPRRGWGWHGWHRPHRRHPGNGCCWFLFCCIPCLWCCAPETEEEEQPIISASTSHSENSVIESNSVGVPVGTTKHYREIKTLEFREGDVPVKFYLNVPEDIEFGQILQVDLGGRAMSVRIPDYVHRGEKVIIIAPAPAANLA